MTTAKKITPVAGNQPAAPTTSVKAPAAPTTSVKAPAAPTTSAKAPVAPTTSVKAPVAPTTSVKAPAAPTTSAKAPVAPTTSVKAPAAPTTSAKAPAAKKLSPSKASVAKKLSPAKKAPRKPAVAPLLEKIAKPKKPKLVRDSFTIPKAEYVVLEALKQRAAKHIRAVKKSELLRAGIKALAAMPDAAFLTALANVPAIKTGRPAA